MTGQSGGIQVWRNMKDYRTRQSATDDTTFLSDGGTDSGSKPPRPSTDGGIDSEPDIRPGPVDPGSEEEPTTPTMPATPLSDSRRVHARWFAQVGGAVETTPVVRDGSVYVGTENGFVCSIDQQDGVSNWLFQAPNAVGSPTPGVDLTYVGDRSGNLFALDGMNGTREWCFRVGCWRGGSADTRREHAVRRFARWTGVHARRRNG